MTLCLIFFYLSSIKMFRSRPAILFKKKTLAQVFSSEFCEFSKSTFSTEHLQTTTSYMLSLVYSKIFKNSQHDTQLKSRWCPYKVTVTRVAGFFSLKHYNFTFGIIYLTFWLSFRSFQWLWLVFFASNELQIWEYFAMSSF